MKIRLVFIKKLQKEANLKCPIIVGNLCLEDCFRLIFNLKDKQCSFYIPQISVFNFEIHLYKSCNIRVNKQTIYCKQGP